PLRELRCFGKSKPKYGYSNFERRKPELGGNAESDAHNLKWQNRSVTLLYHLTGKNWR
uniref:Uncharacterized protein n=1 Tax=Mesocestoides corti TaxID=53468 RepID=A0A5K3FTN8_MESCO